MWLAVALSKRDGELACDEGAVARLGAGERIPYGRTLVGLVAGRSFGPSHLFQCSTTMTAGKKALSRRIEQLARRTETRKVALFAVLSLLALITVFTFSGQQGVESDSSPDYADFLTQVEQAQSLSLSPPLTSSAPLPGPLTDPELLQEARALLESAHDFLGAEDARDWEEESLATYRLTLAGDGWEASYRLLPPAGATTDPWTYVLAQDPSGRVTEPPIAALPLHPDRLAVLLRQQEHSGNSPRFYGPAAPPGRPSPPRRAQPAGRFFILCPYLRAFGARPVYPADFFLPPPRLFLHFCPLRKR